MRIFIQVVAEINNDDIGVKKKVDSQVKALNEYGLNFKLLRVVREPRIKRAIPFQTSSINWSKLPIENVEGIYIRRTYCDIRMLGYLRKYKRKNPFGKIAIEYPTYPYDQEENRNNIIVWRDRVYRRFLHWYVDKAIIISNKDFTSVHDIPALRIINGVDLSSYPLRNHMWEGGKAIKLLCVANFQYWHGIDRLLLGLKNYYERHVGTKNVEIHLVGSGNELEKLKKMVDCYQLQKCVVFHGRLVGKKLIDMYDFCDIGVESLGSFRKGISVSSSLKSREYLAVGLPFIYSGKIDVLAKRDVDFVQNHPESEEPINIERVVEFVDRLSMKYNCCDLTKLIRKFAEEHVDMKITMKSVVDFYKSENEKIVIKTQ